MKKISIIGIGLGSDTLTREAQSAIERADVLLGAPRVLEQYGGESKPSYPCYLPEDVAERVEREDAAQFAVLVSGDVGFYSAAAGLNEALTGYDVRLVPGIPTVAAFFARLKLPWQDAVLLSAHGREANVVDTVRRSRLTFCLTGNNAGELCAALVRAGLGHVKTYVGENLGSQGEHIRETSAGALARGEYSALTVLLFENAEYDDRVPSGLPDGGFIRLPGIPMTKSETRSLVMSKLMLRPESICWDVGAGTGSVTVEMALSAYRGRVYAVERRREAIPLIEQNCAAFHVGNAVAVCGEAPGSLEALPSPDAVFVGGSGGGLDSVISAAIRKNPRTRLVVTAVTFETSVRALISFSRAGFSPEIVQINTSRGKKVGKSHLMEAQNPITILSAGGRA